MIKLQQACLASGILFSKPCLVAELQRQLVWEEDNEGQSILWEPKKDKSRRKMSESVRTRVSEYTPGIHIDLLK